MNKKKNTRRILLVALLSYVAIGIIVGLFLYNKGVFFKKDDDVVYTFEDDDSTGLNIPDVSIVSETPIGNNHVEAEPDTSETEEEAPVEEKKFYSFTVNTQKTILRIRDNPNLFGKVLARMPKGTNGYVLEYGDDWCLVTDGTTIGYSSTNYLVLTELDPDNLPEDFPEDYR